MQTRTTVNFFDIRKLGERMRVAKRNVDDTVVRQVSEGCKNGGLLASTDARGRDKEAAIFARISA